jgi:NAD(P)-dependent dehydrogenase (short-subunit alcohol dehydrogenase family)
MRVLSASIAFVNACFDYQPAADLLRDRVILITGATGGLGSALASACAGLGATTVLVGRTIKKLEALYDRIEQAGGPQPAIAPLNLLTAGWKDYEDLAATLEREFGRLDGLVHAAALFKDFARLEDLDPREWMDSLQVNLTAPYTLTRVCLPLLRASEDASVIHVTDVAESRAFQGIYGVTKRAAESLFLSWAQETRQETTLRTNIVCPGPMRTALRARGYSGEATESVPPPEAALPRLLWLLGSDSRGVSGQTF